jgi:3-hydroxyacyl-CoA dehydrogenase/enoyl-CoA hydratase/3-hydroxybutyryl-CoA epimerase
LGRPAPDLTRLKEKVDAGKLGRKSGEGFYLWQDGKAVKPESHATAPPDLLDRLILVMVNECVACLREKVVEEEDFVDAAVIFGTGFAPFRGGPLTYARSRGADVVRARLEDLAARYGDRFTPDAGWAALAVPRSPAPQQP